MLISSVVHLSQFGGGMFPYPCWLVVTLLQPVLAAASEGEESGDRRLYKNIL